MSVVIKLLITALLVLAPASTLNASLRDWADGQCLASALHYEARGEPLKGRRAVLDTITNRMLATGQSACEVVMKRGQFSWTKSKPLLIYNDEQREKLSEVVGHPIVLTNENYRYFYSGIKPSWAYNMMCRKINKQTFCEGK